MGKKGEGKRSTALEFLASTGYLEATFQVISTRKPGAKMRLALDVTTFPARI